MQRQMRPSVPPCCSLRQNEVVNQNLRSRRPGFVQRTYKNLHGSYNVRTRNLHAAYPIRARRVGVSYTGTVQAQTFAPWTKECDVLVIWSRWGHGRQRILWE
jgi:hypothetical protein